MCGIVGYYCAGEPPSNIIENLKFMFRESILRGEHATGVAYADLGIKKLIWEKQPIPATEFVNNPIFNEMTVKPPKYVIGHLRFATKGLPSNNENNHPFISKIHKWAFVHNGVMYDEIPLVKQYNLQRTAETDSEVLLRLIEKFYRGDIVSKNIYECMERAINLVTGTITFAILDGWTGDIYVYNGGRDIFIAYDKTNMVFYICSMKSVLEHMLIPTYELGMFPVYDGISIARVKDNTVVKLSAEMEIHKINRTSKLEPKRSVTYYA